MDEEELDNLMQSFQDAKDLLRYKRQAVSEARDDVNQAHWNLEKLRGQIYRETGEYLT